MIITGEYYFVIEYWEHDASKDITTKTEEKDENGNVVVDEDNNVVYTTDTHCCLTDDKPTPTRADDCENCSEGCKCCTCVKRVTYTTNPIYYDGGDVVLTQRAIPEINISATATGFRMTLANNQILDERTIDVDSDVPLAAQIDNSELVYGSTVDLEYTVTITNKSLLTYDYLDLVLILPDGWNYDEGSYLITADATNDSYNSVARSR